MKSSLLSSQASDAESYEVQQLQSMFSSGSGFSGRGSSIPVGLYVKFEVSMDNRQKAEEARRDRQKRDQIRMDKARRQYEETQERRAKVLGRNATVKQEMVERNLEQGKMVRAHKAAWEHLRQEAREQLFSETKKKVQAARSNDARLDELEAAADMAERNQATEERNARTLAARTFRANLAKSKRERAHEQREHEQRALSHRIKSVTTRKQEQAEKTRMDTHHGKMLVRNEEQERLRKVALSRARAVECHEAAARAKEEMLLRKQIEVQNQDRISQIAIVQAKNSLLLNNQKKRRSQFESRYVSTRAAASFEASDFRNYYMMDESADKEIAHANKSLFNRIKTISAATDSDITDDSAGAERLKAAAASKARREAEARRLAKENAEMHSRLAKVKASIDNELSDDITGVYEARAAAAKASEAKRKAEAMRLAKQNMEMRERLKNVKAATDDDITDEKAGAARITAGQEAKARKAAEAERIEQQNKEMRERVAATAAKTDDDIMDEAAGYARAELAAQKKADREAEKARLEQDAKDMKEKLANVQAKVDDDIDDDPAGIARAAKTEDQKGLFGGGWSFGWGGGGSKPAVEMAGVDISIEGSSLTGGGEEVTDEAKKTSSKPDDTPEAAPADRTKSPTNEAKRAEDSSKTSPTSKTKTSKPSGTSEHGDAQGGGGSSSSSSGSQVASPEPGKASPSTAAEVHAPQTASDDSLRQHGIDAAQPAGASQQQASGSAASAKAADTSATPLPSVPVAADAH